MLVVERPSDRRLRWPRLVATVGGRRRSRQRISPSLADRLLGESYAIQNGREDPCRGAETRVAMNVAKLRILSCTVLVLASSVARTALCSSAPRRVRGQGRLPLPFLGIDLASQPIRRRLHHRGAGRQLVWRLPVVAYGKIRGRPENRRAHVPVHGGVHALPDPVCVRQRYGRESLVGRGLAASEPPGRSGRRRITWRCRGWWPSISFCTTPACASRSTGKRRRRRTQR